MTDPAPKTPCAKSAIQLVQGDLAVVPTVAVQVTARAALIAGAAYLAGVPRDSAFRAGVAGSLALEAFLLLYSMRQF